MKIIKKIAAIMLSVMMVLGMCSVVGAEGTGTTSGTLTPKGSITINNAAQGETYNIYRILDLESYSGNNYAYKLRRYDSSSTYNWNTFIDSGDIKDKYVTLDGDYVTWKNGVGTTADKAAEFAQKALKYAQDSTEIAPDDTKEATTSTVTFDNLPLGYYLVETSVGTVLALDTTKPKWEIDDKNVAPTVKKEVSKTESGTYGETSTASIGDTVYFKTTITAQPGAKNYVLHDTMSSGLTFNLGSIEVTEENGTTSIVTPTYYKVVTNPKDKCTFHIEFQDYFNKLITTSNKKVIVTYSATLNENTAIGATGNINTTKLTYGNNSETQEKITKTYTYEIPVWKYTNIKGNAGNSTKKPLSGAKFILTKTGETAGINLKSITTPSGKEGAYYIVDKNGSTCEVTTDNTGKFTIRGLDEGTYELVEKEAPDGYNKLSGSIEIKIDENGSVSYGTVTNATWVEVENKSGSLLPHTGGMGTTLFYIFGAILVIGSGVVLITKKRMK